MLLQWSDMAFLLPPCRTHPGPKTQLPPMGPTTSPHVRLPPQQEVLLQRSDVEAFLLSSLHAVHTLVP